ncbi:MAG: ABC transporter ATP-binding protein [Oscillospiraceae bacterium]|jgi:multidrug/hemolysin transport system ATP-binding protein|nr:ABC transporter ATP-binding protein [Oscillospiraceae bacterium]
MSNIISVKELTKIFDGKTAVDGLSFDVPSGSLFAFLGQNGAGKSTTINILLGLLKCDGGSFDYIGLSDGEERKRQIGVVFQNNVFDDLMTVEENLTLYGKLYLAGSAVKSRCREVIEQFGLGDFAKQRFGSLSGGQKRKAEIARALFMSPKLLFLDEPTTGLDPRTRAEVWSIIHGIRRKSGMTVFLTTHYMEETADADKVVIIHKGKLVAENSSAELKAQYSYDRLRIKPIDAALLESRLTELGAAFERTADTYSVQMSDTEHSIELLYALKSNIRSYEAVKGSMDDVFLNAVGEQLQGVNI